MDIKQNPSINIQSMKGFMVFKYDVKLEKKSIKGLIYLAQNNFF